MLQLHPLKIPDGWAVVQNNFFVIDPRDAVMESGQLGFPFFQDILHFSHRHFRMALDLGWYPDGAPNGEFRLVLIQWPPPPQHDLMPKQTIEIERNGVMYTYSLEPLLVGNAWANPLVEFRSSDQYAVATCINDTLAKVSLRQIGSF